MKVSVAFSAIAVSLTLVPSAYGQLETLSAVEALYQSDHATSQVAVHQAGVVWQSHVESAQVSLTLDDWLTAEGPPADEKGTPGNRDGCNANTCGTS